MSITDPQFGEENQQIAGAIDVYGSSSDFFGNLNDILGARSGIADTIGADAVDVVLGDLGDYSSSGGGTSLSDQIATEVTTLQADNALAQMEKQLKDEVAKIQSNTVFFITNNKNFSTYIYIVKKIRIYTLSKYITIGKR